MMIYGRTLWPYFVEEFIEKLFGSSELFPLQMYTDSTLSQIIFTKGLWKSPERSYSLRPPYYLTCLFIAHPNHMACKGLEVFGAWSVIILVCRTVLFNFVYVWQAVIITMLSHYKVTIIWPILGNFISLKHDMIRAIENTECIFYDLLPLHSVWHCYRRYRFLQRHLSFLHISRNSQI